MHDSDTYLAILEEGATTEARKLLMLQGRIRFGAPDAATQATLEAIADLERLERLSANFVTVSSWRELLQTP